MGGANGTAVGQEQAAGHGPAAVAAGGGIGSSWTPMGSSGSGVAEVGGMGTCGTDGSSVTAVTRACNGSGALAGNVNGARGTGNGFGVAGKSWAWGTGLSVGGDRADGADRAGGGTWGMETQAEGKGRVTGLAGIIGRAQGRGGAATGGHMMGTAGGSNWATGNSCPSRCSARDFGGAQGGRSSGTGGVGSSGEQMGGFSGLTMG